MPLWKTVCPCLALFLLFAFPATAKKPTAARLVRARVILNGKVVLEGSTSDAGRVDADGVWDYLHKLRFKPTDNFKPLNIAEDAEQATLENTALPGQPRTLEVFIAYGGKAYPRSLKIIRTPADRFGRQWRLADDEIKRMLDSRYISRSDARRLDNPARTNR